MKTLVALVLTSGTDVAVTIGVALFTAACGVAVNLWASSRSSAKFEGAVGAKFEAVREHIARLDLEDSQQWTVINKVKDELGETKQDVARLQAVQIKVNGAAGGRT